ncbi:MAG TPA: RelA/SpoT AH/RIS domain-containing protein, partial [Candidatus Nanoarchaeia archaeon]|nr:RelA/SpoT AH/RIS domain-containing protein [Candidatus Nanoarchaeia archaeon]
HGPGDQTVMIPAGTTALDGAFYLFGHDALRTQKTFVDGIAVPLHTKLHHAASLTIELSKHPTFQREWLNWVQTGLATAQIRSALASVSEKKKIVIGKHLLQDILSHRKHEHLEEFDEKMLERRLAEHAYPSMQQTYQAIGDGRLEPMEIYRILFEKPGLNSHKEKRSYVLMFEIALDQRDQLYQILGQFVPARIKMVERSERNAVAFTVSVLLSDEEMQSLKDELLAGGARHVKFSLQLSILLSHIAVPVLSLLWGLDCLLGKLLIVRGVSPYDLTPLRFATLFLMSLGYLILQSWRSKRSILPSKHLSPFNWYLFLSGTAIFATALSSYVALQTISTLTYGMSMNIGVAAMLLAEQARSRSRSLPLMGTCVAMIVGTLVLLHKDTGFFLSIGFWSGIGCGLGFAVYSYASRQYQTQESVHSRYPQFIFFYSFVALVLCIPLVVVTQFTLWQSSLLFPAFLFVTFLTALPYIVYFELLKYEEVKVTWSYIPPFLIIMTIGEFLLYGNRSWILLIPLTLSLAWLKYYPPTALRSERQ